MSLVLIVISSVVVGLLAQKWKGRTGAAWGAMTFLAIAATWLFSYFCVALADPKVLRQENAWLALTVVVCLIVGGLFAIIIATLPHGTPVVVKDKEPEPTSTEGMRKCPYCAELIKAEAKVCRYCHSDLTQ